MKIETIGAFQKLPMVMPSTDILQSALRKAKRVSPTKGKWYFYVIRLILPEYIYVELKVLKFRSACLTGIANIAKRERNRGAKQLDALMKANFLTCNFICILS